MTLINNFEKLKEYGKFMIQQGLDKILNNHELNLSFITCFTSAST